MGMGKRVYWVGVRLSKAEYLAINQAATMARLNTSDFVRKSLDETAKNVTRDSTCEITALGTVGPTVQQSVQKNVTRDSTCVNETLAVVKGNPLGGSKKTCNKALGTPIALTRASDPDPDQKLLGSDQDQETEGSAYLLYRNTVGRRPLKKSRGTSHQQNLFVESESTAQSLPGYAQWFEAFEQEYKAVHGHAPAYQRSKAGSMFKSIWQMRPSATEPDAWIMQVGEALRRYLHDPGDRNYLANKRHPLCWFSDRINEYLHTKPKNCVMREVEMPSEDFLRRFHNTHKNGANHGNGHSDGLQPR